MKRILFVILSVLLTCLTNHAQETNQRVTATAGSHHQNEHIHLEWTIGEIMVRPYSNNGLVLTQGLHQGHNLLQIDKVTLTMRLPDGNGTVNPFPGTFNFDIGQTVQISAIPEEGWFFCGWTGDIDDIADISSINTSIIMNSNSIITANFASVNASSGVLPVTGTGHLTGDVPFTFGFKSETGSLTHLELDVYLANYAGEGNRVYAKHLGFNLPAGSENLNIWIDDIDAQFASNTRENLVLGFGQGDPERGEWYVRFAEAVGFIAGQSNSAVVKSRLFFEDAGAGEGIWTLTLNTKTIGETPVEFLVALSDDKCGKWGENNWTLPGTQAFLYDIALYTLAMDIPQGGFVNPDPGISGHYFGEVVNISAVPDEGWVFCGWTGDIETIADPLAENTTITIEDDYSINAEFAAVFATTGITPDPQEGPVAGDVEFTFGFESKTGTLEKLELDVYLAQYAGEGNRVYAKHLGFNLPAGSENLNIWIDDIDAQFASNTRENLVLGFGQGDPERGEWYVRFAEAVGFSAGSGKAEEVKTRLFFENFGNTEGKWTLTLDTYIINETPIEFLVALKDDKCGQWGENNYTLPGTKSFLYEMFSSDTFLHDMTIGTGSDTCFSANQTITIAGNGTSFLVESGASVLLVAGESIKFLDGTNIVEGAYLNAYITTDGNYCQNPTAMLAAKDEIFSDDPSLADIPDIDTFRYGDNKGLFFRIYPNPTDGRFTLEFLDQVNSETITVEIFGTRGETMLSQSFSGIQSFVFDLPWMNSGLYIIKVRSGLKTGVEKLIKR